MVIAGVDHAKSTTISVLVNDELDDGRGSARKKILQHYHEKESGRTSSITKNYLHVNDKDFISFIDLAGHEKYLRTTLHGITGYSANYAMLIIGSNMGVTRMAKEHLSVVTSLKIPVFVVVTKIDICPMNVMKETISDVKKLLKKTRWYKFPTEVMDIDQINKILN